MSLQMALENIKVFHKQQHQLFEEFVKLREKYDLVKSHLAEVLWEYVPQNIQKEEFECIPLRSENVVRNI
jgi:hypothetical protein